jgi:5-methylcytosine-specific restriction endonuclease McrA
LLSQPELAELEALLDRLALGDGAESEWVEEYRYALTRAAAAVDIQRDDETRVRLEVRLRLAMHLCPASALQYDAGNRVPRWRLIADFLRVEHGRTGPTVDAVARSLARLLNGWDAERQSVGAWRDELLHEQGGRCAHCRFRFVDSESALLREDPFKPYSRNAEVFPFPEVDHIEAVSALGRNERRNLQVLCGLCNRGKGTGLGLDPGYEMRYSGQMPTRIPVAHVAAVFFYSLARSPRRCTTCGTDDAELTIRPRRASGAFARSNLEPACLGCAGVSNATA